MTCDRTLVLASGALFREVGYTALSRGRTENRLYVIAPEPPDVDVGHGIYGARDEPLGELVAALERSNHKRLAVDQRAPVVQQAIETPDFGIEL
jgi:hypothetical protein